MCGVSGACVGVCGVCARVRVWFGVVCVACVVCA